MRIVFNFKEVKMFLFFFCVFIPIIATISHIWITKWKCTEMAIFVFFLFLCSFCLVLVYSRRIIDYIDDFTQVFIRNMRHSRISKLFGD